MAKLSPRKYAIDLLEMNPLFQASEIIDQRNRFFGKPRKQTQVAFDPEAVQKQRIVANKLLANIRDDFWSLGLPELDERLRAPVLQNLPDIKAAALKLRKLAKLRPRFPMLLQEKWCNKGLFRAFKEIVVLSPRDAGPTKERLLQQVAQSRSLKQCQRCVDRIRQEYPDLYQIEADWFVMVEQVKPMAAARESYQPSSYGGGMDFGIPWWFFFVAMFILRIVVRLLLRGGQ